MVNVRTDLQFDDAHVPGSICNPAVRAGFGTKLGWLADRAREIVLVGRDDDDALRAAGLARAAGVGNVTGFLAGGMTSWREDEAPDGESTERIDIDALRARADAVQVLDVRERSEWEEGHIPGSIHHAVPRHRRRPGGDRSEPACRRRLLVRASAAPSRPRCSRVSGRAR